MADKTKIEWTDSTWNVITGCSVVSPGCTNCYAMKLAGTRLKNHESRKGLTMPTKAGPVWTGEVRFNEQWLTQPLAWKRPRRIFVCAHGDLFAEGVTDEWLDRIFAIMALCPQHTFQVLTKRPERMREYLTHKWREPFIQLAGFEHYQKAFEAGQSSFGHIRYRDDCWFVNWPLPNVWLGVSVEDQKRADERIPVLLDTPAALRWISAEPLLGPLDIAWALSRNPLEMGAGFLERGHFSPGAEMLRPLEWIVAGGESGPNARPMHPDWVRSLRDQCAAAEVPFNFKQWGEYRPCAWKLERFADEYDNEYKQRSEDLCSRLAVSNTGHVIPLEHAPWSAERTLPPPASHQAIKKVGKSEAGRLLDGVLHDAFPEAQP